MSQKWQNLDDHDEGGRIGVKEAGEGRKEVAKQLRKTELARRTRTAQRLALPLLLRRTRIACRPSSATPNVAAPPAASASSADLSDILSIRIALLL